MSKFFIMAMKYVCCQHSLFGINIVRYTYKPAISLLWKTCAVYGSKFCLVSNFQSTQHRVSSPISVMLVSKEFEG